MDIGTGIAIAGVWIFAGIASQSKEVTNAGMIAAIIIALSITLFFA